MSSKNQQRLSQLITTFGPGSMIDLPTRSVIVGGLNRWQMRNNTWKAISEPRLVALLQKFLSQEGRIAPDTVITLRTPPIEIDALRGREPDGIEVFVFPKWFTCEHIETIPNANPERLGRRLVEWRDLEPAGGKRKYRTPGKLSDVTPIRFVAACKKAHIQDIDWRWVLHRGVACRQQMWIEERGTSADPADTLISCECGRPSLSLQQAFVPGSLGTCHGERPWLGTDVRETCTEDLKLLTRTATNTYFPQVVTIISLPSGDDDLSKVVARNETDLSRVNSEEDLHNALKFNQKLDEAFRGHSPTEIYSRILSLRRQAVSDAEAPPQLAEFDRLASGQPVIGENSPASVLFAETLARPLWDNNGSIDMGFVKNLVAVHRVREVMCQYGFTRFEAAPTIIEEEFEDIRLAVDGAPLGDPIEWLPAIEQFGEGFFIHVDGLVISDWLGRPGVQARAEELGKGFARWRASQNGASSGRFPGVEYVLLHSLAHALMIEVALDCGYPASSVKERIYAMRDPALGPETGRYGIMLYTASAGAQGTLGGLVGAAVRLPQILKGALQRLEVCSNDPICSDHKPDDRNDDRALHGAACHGCLLVAETSCERRNLLLDRALLIDTIATNTAAFF